MDFRFTGSTVAVGDWVLLIRKDEADANVGNECPHALATLSTTQTYPDHGGAVVFDAGGYPTVTVTLPGVIDPIDPLTTDNESPTGTFYMCHADQSARGFGEQPVAADFSFNKNFVVLPMKYRASALLSSVIVSPEKYTQSLR